MGVTYNHLQGWDFGCDENYVPYLFKNGVMVDLPFDPDNPNYREELERRKEEAIKAYEQAAIGRESEDMETLKSYMHKLNMMGRFQVLTYAEDMTMIPKYQKKED